MLGHRRHASKMEHTPIHLSLVLIHPPSLTFIKHRLRSSCGFVQPVRIVSLHLCSFHTFPCVISLRLNPENEAEEWSLKAFWNIFGAFISLFCAFRASCCLCWRLLPCIAAAVISDRFPGRTQEEGETEEWVAPQVTPPGSRERAGEVNERMSVRNLWDGAALGNRIRLARRVGFAVCDLKFAEEKRRKQRIRRTRLVFSDLSNISLFCLI